MASNGTFTDANLAEWFYLNHVTKLPYRLSGYAHIMHALRSAGSNRVIFDDLFEKWHQNSRQNTAFEVKQGTIVAFATVNKKL